MTPKEHGEIWKNKEEKQVMKSAKFLAIMGGVSLLLAEAASANAATPTLRVRCEVQSNRSKISVDLKKAVNSSSVKAVVTNTNGDPVQADNSLIVVAKEAEFDFDSDDDDVLAGATRISPDFINRNTPQITATILELPGLSKTATCKVKK
jgi:hypothetical protein